MQDNQLNPAVLIIAAVIALSAGVWFGFDHSGKSAGKAPPDIQGTILPAPKILSDFQLIDNQEQEFTLASLRTQWHMLFIGYTFCPDICPTTLQVMKQVTKIMEERGLTPPRVVFISIDPERDKPELLSEYVKYFNKDYIGVTGAENDLQNLTSQLAVHYRKAAGTSGDINASDYLMDHSAVIMLTNPDGNLQAYLSPPHTPAQIVDSIIRTQTFYE